MQTTVISSEVATSQDEAKLRRRLVASAVAALILSTLHFGDHVIRGWLVVSRGLNPAWNYSGWPFQAEFSPAFTASLLTVYGLLLVGLVLTLRGKVWAGYWLVTAFVLATLVALVHFVGPTAEVSVIWESYGNPVAAVLSLTVLAGILVGLAWMAADAIDVRRRSGRW